ncbi:hypothetical protein [Montanilutibacter psychrotolerans]|uniref:Uncharacterized protein n=1 Tax=Montanilutibacter psychrotolerans TaxID=1327343 RepID=A0A3M8SP38_9GAMM|nr:hypothetical protein [Lysobacter psychrotolerans]RNF83108.1 hypothetical protein EER27_11350 [Lysobacter psychrotolerans]
MIINSIADGNVTTDRLVEFKPRPISYNIKGSTGVLTGEVAANAYVDVDARSTGSGPYQVTVGYVNHSYEAKPVAVDSNDSLVTFWMAFPAGPNRPTSFVYTKQK